MGAIYFDSRMQDDQRRARLYDGGLFVFTPTRHSTALMHASVPNLTGRTRFSIDFRTVHLGDLKEHRGAPNVDSECTGTSLRDFLRVSDLERAPEVIAERYDAGAAELFPLKGALC